MRWGPLDASRGGHRQTGQPRTGHSPFGVELERAPYLNDGAWVRGGILAEPTLGSGRRGLGVHDQGGACSRWVCELPVPPLSFCRTQQAKQQQQQACSTEESLNRLITAKQPRFPCWPPHLETMVSSRAGRTEKTKASRRRSFLIRPTSCLNLRRPHASPPVPRCAEAPANSLLPLESIPPCLDVI
jgi:hypothetical protein